MYFLARLKFQANFFRQLSGENLTKKTVSLLELTGGGGV